MAYLKPLKQKIAQDNYIKKEMKYQTQKEFIVSGNDVLVQLSGL